MQQYLALISSFLQKESSCFLPDIGILKCEYQPAFEKDGHLYPPSTRIILDQSDTSAEHNILDEMKAHFHFSTEDAKKEWNKICETIKKQQKPIAIPAIGILEQNKEGAIIFKAHPSKDFYTPVSLPEIKQQPEVELSDEEEPKKTNKVLSILLPIILLALFALGYFGYNYFFSTTTTNHSATNTIKNNDTTSSVIPATPDSVIMNKPTTGKVAITDSIHFAVIYQVYHSKKNAEKHLKRMHGWGHDVSFYTRDSATFMLGYSYYGLPADTAKRLEEIHNTYGGHPFIIYPEK